MAPLPVIMAGTTLPTTGITEQPLGIVPISPGRTIQQQRITGPRRIITGMQQVIIGMGGPITGTAPITTIGITHQTLRIIGMRIIMQQVIGIIPAMSMPTPTTTGIEMPIRTIGIILRIVGATPTTIGTILRIQRITGMQQMAGIQQITGMQRIIGTMPMAGLTVPPLDGPTVIPAAHPAAHPVVTTIFGTIGTMPTTTTTTTFGVVNQYKKYGEKWEELGNKF